MFDRRKNPREFFVAGWDPYVIQLTAANRDTHPKKRAETRPPKAAPTRWRAMLMQRNRAR